MPTIGMRATNAYSQIGKKEFVGARLQSRQQKSRNPPSWRHLTLAAAASSAIPEPRHISGLEKAVMAISSAFPLFVLGAALLGLRNPSSFSFFSPSFMTPALGYVFASELSCFVFFFS